METVFSYRKRERRNTPKPTKTAIAARDLRNSSTSPPTMHSKTATTVVSAASERKRKNAKPQMRPWAIEPKTRGSASKISPGPEVTSTPKLAQTGKTTSPARTAITHDKA